MSARGEVFVLYPRGVRTGGPEALHQLVHELRGHGVDARLVALRGTEDAARVPDYARYDAPESPMPPDLPGVTVVIPENRLDLVWRYRSARVVLWWLSIDFATLFYAERRLRTLAWNDPVELGKRAVLLVAQAAYPVRRRRLLARTNVTHVAQCDYAREFLRRRLGVEAALLSDVTRPAPDTGPPHVRDRIVAYNPSKGGRLVDRLLRRVRPGWEVVPLVGMTGEEVQATLARAAVYLDLGHHPGKDRMPREAASAGAVVVVADRGAAANGLDTPIPSRFRIPLRLWWERRAADAVDAVLADPAAAAREQEDLRRAVRAEARIFTAEVAAVFGTTGPRPAVIHEPASGARPEALVR